MSTEQNKMNEVTGPRNMTCFVFYGENEDLTPIFDILKDFRVRHGLKFSHHPGYIYFIISSEHLDELSKVRPFRVSKFHTRTEYSCNSQVANEIQKQRDSFVRVRWIEEEGKLVFTSRIKSNAHNKLVRRLFKVANQELDNESYTFIKNDNDNDNVFDNALARLTIEKPNLEGFIKVENGRSKREYKPRESRESRESGEYKPREPREYKPREPREFKPVSKYDNNKFEKEVQAETPKIRGKRVKSTNA